jgi:hypothetical protein
LCHGHGVALLQLFSAKPKIIANYRGQISVDDKRRRRCCDVMSSSVGRILLFLSWKGQLKAET